MFFTTDSGSSNNEVKMIGSSEAIGGAIVEGFDMALIAGVLKFWEVLQEPEPPTESEREFQEQKRLFDRIEPLFLEPYRGLFVISHNGEILDADQDLDILINRFFAEHDDVPIYVTKVGGQIREVIDTHF